MEKSLDRLKILNKIEEYERLGKWDVDVEDDPETKTLLPSEVDYLDKKFFSKIKTRFANFLGKSHFEKLLRKKQMIIKEFIGLENLQKVEGGAIITCNHFNPCDNYAIWKAIKKVGKDKRLWKIIREGNYTNFPGFYGFIFRNCNTLPLSSNLQTMKNFFSAVHEILLKGEKILIYPEQAMWWNYKKPRPLKKGAFQIASNNFVPIIPAFITMQDSNVFDINGFPVQEYVVHFLEPIYPDKNLSVKENLEIMQQKNYELWVRCYENFYGKKLKYTYEG